MVINEIKCWIEQTKQWENKFPIGSVLNFKSDINDNEYTNMSIVFWDWTFDGCYANCQSVDGTMKNRFFNPIYNGYTIE